MEVDTQEDTVTGDTLVDPTVMVGTAGLPPDIPPMHHMGTGTAGAAEDQVSLFLEELTITLSEVLQPRIMQVQSEEFSSAAVFAFAWLCLYQRLDAAQLEFVDIIEILSLIEVLEVMTGMDTIIPKQLP